MVKSQCELFLSKLPFPTITTESSDKALGEIKSRLVIGCKLEVDPVNPKNKPDKTRKHKPKILKIDTDTSLRAQEVVLLAGWILVDPL